MRQISMLDFYIMYYLSMKRESKISEIYNYVSALIPVTRQTFSYRIKSLYTRDHLIKESYITSSDKGNAKTSIYYELTDSGVKCYNETKQTLTALLITQ